MPDQTPPVLAGAEVVSLRSWLPASGGADHFHGRVVAAFQELEQLPGDGPLQAPADVAGTLTLGRASCGVGTAVMVIAEPHHHGVSRPVELLVTGAVQPMPVTCREDAWIALAPAMA
ncbi:MAG TPA: hypothetical protein VGC06_24250 [Actinomycetes bacterium]